jgi:hypothetical protein
MALRILATTTTEATDTEDMRNRKRRKGHVNAIAKEDFFGGRT